MNRGQGFIFCRPRAHIPWWRHQMETFSALLAICAGSTHKGQWRGALMFSLICVWINSWVNNREAGDLRHYRAHYNVSVMHSYLDFSDISIFRRHQHSTYWGREKWLHFCKRHFQAHFREWDLLYFIQISLKFVPYGSIDKHLALVKIITWRRTGDRP